MAEPQKPPIIVPDGSVPSHYFNGFSVTLGNSDLTTYLLQDGKPVAALSMSFTTAKTLVKMMGDIISRLEKVTGRDIMTTEMIEAGLKQLIADEQKR